MQVIVNGESKQTQAGTVRDLIVELGMADQAVAVELNKDLVPRRKHEQTSIQEGDQLELVTLVGGG